LIPAILLFAFYVQFHGDFGPGGGFQAGVIFATAIILYALINGTSATVSKIPLSMMRYGAALGVLIYGGVGVAGMLLGGKFLDYNVLAADPVHGQHWGIFLVELGVGITVACVMIGIYYLFTQYKK
jgi:multicomponent Na+:H+ antiporter subunit B